MGDFILFCKNIIEKIMSSKAAVFYFANMDKRSFRFLLLIGAGCFGLLLGVFADAQFFCDYLGQDETVAKYLATAVVGVPVFMFLWYFRTRDVRQQIEKTQGLIEKAQEQIKKTQEQIDGSQRQSWQNQFNDAIGNLTNISLISTNANPDTHNSQQSINDMIKEAIGVQSLLNLSEITPDFHELITIIFENKIKEFTNYTFVHNKPRYNSRVELIEDMQKWLSNPPNPQE